MHIRAQAAAVCTSYTGTWQISPRYIPTYPGMLHCNVITRYPASKRISPSMRALQMGTRTHDGPARGPDHATKLNKLDQARSIDREPRIVCVSHELQLRAVATRNAWLLHDWFAPARKHCTDPFTFACGTHLENCNALAVHRGYGSREIRVCRYLYGTGPWLRLALQAPFALHSSRTH